LIFIGGDILVGYEEEENDENKDEEGSEEDW